MTGSRVLLTGAGGFTGRHACAVLALAGWEVVAVGSPRAERGFAAGLGAAVADRCDLTKESDVKGLMRQYQPNAVLHLAGQNAVDTSRRDPAVTLSVNLMSTVYLLEAIRSESLSCRVVVAGSMLRTPLGQSFEAPHPYAFSKTLQSAAAQAWHRWYGLEVIVVEPSNLIGPGGSSGLCGKIARWAIEAEAGAKVSPFVLSSVEESRDFLDVRDASGAYERLLREGEPGGCYALESGSLRTLGEVKEVFDAETVVSLPWQIGSSDAASPVSRDTEPIRRLGWQPAIPFGQSVRDLLQDERRRWQQQTK